MEVNIRINELELRSCSNDPSMSTHATLEIVEWQSVGHCICVAYWISNGDDELDLQFVGDRPFECDKGLVEISDVVVTILRAEKKSEPVFDAVVKSKEKPDFKLLSGDMIWLCKPGIPRL